jgi:hypothetical protein
MGFASQTVADDRVEDRRQEERCAGTHKNDIQHRRPLFFGSENRMQGV